MKSIVKTTSMFGYTPDIFKRKFKKKKNLNNVEILIIDDKDGYLVLYPLSLGYKCTVYEPNKIFIEGGKIEVPVNVPNTNDYVFVMQNTLGLIDRVKLQFKEDNLKIINENFYSIDNVCKYDYVAAARSLDRKENENYSIKEKIEKLKNAVKDDGYLFIEYLIATKDDDYNNYPKNTYLRSKEIENYFDKNNWYIISNDVKVIDDLLTPLNKSNKSVLVGYLDVQKKKTPIKKEKINNKKTRLTFDDNKISCNHSYIINGIVR